MMRPVEAVRGGAVKGVGGEFVSDEDVAAFFKRLGVKNHGA